MSVFFFVWVLKMFFGLYHFFCDCIIQYRFHLPLLCLLQSLQSKIKMPLEAESLQRQLMFYC